MRHYKVILLILLFVLSSIPQVLYAWRGDGDFQPENREEMLRIATQMVEFHWSPKNTFRNPDRSETQHPDEIYYAGTEYNGVAYTQQPWGEKDNWNEFYSEVNTTEGGEPS
jgi:hypothetical protein